MLPVGHSMSSMDKFDCACGRDVRRRLQATPSLQPSPAHTCWSSGSFGLGQCTYRKDVSEASYVAVVIKMQSYIKQSLRTTRERTYAVNRYDWATEALVCGLRVQQAKIVTSVLDRMDNHACERVCDSVSLTLAGSLPQGPELLRRSL